MNRREFLKLFGKAVAVGVAAQVAPEILRPVEKAPEGATGMAGPG